MRKNDSKEELRIISSGLFIEWIIFYYTLW